MKQKTRFDLREISTFEAEAKIGLIATVDPAGEPHLSFISSLQARGPRELIWGQFSEGRSKSNVRQNPKAAFLIMMPDRRLWRGKAVWTGARTEGPEYENYNQKPMFRYNAYFGIHTVHYMDLVDTTVESKLPLARSIFGMLASAIVAGAWKKGSSDGARVMNSWSEKLFRRPDSLKYLAWIDEDGFPKIVPALQTRAAGDNRVIFTPTVCADELAAIPAGKSMVAFALTTDMEDVLVRGKFSGFERRRGLPAGAIDIEMVYNSMPPLAGQIYPPLDLDPVTEF